MSHRLLPTILPHPELASVLSERDLSAFCELSDTSQIQAWTRGKVARYNKYIDALLAIHNSIAPINKLPTEILQQVFAHIPSKSEWCDASWMISLQSVCRRWRSVLLSTLEYWQRGLHTVLDSRSLAVDPDEDEDTDEDTDEDEDEGTIRRRYLRDLFLDRSAPLPLELNRCHTDHSGWKEFENYFDRLTVFEVKMEEEDELYYVVHAITTSMKHLEKLELSMAYEFGIYPRERVTLAQWQAEDLPCLRELRISSRLFSRATTVPSLRAVTFYRGRDIASLSELLDALEACPALTSLNRLCFYTPGPTRDRNFGGHTLDRIVHLPNLRYLDVLGEIPDLSLFFSCVSFPPDTKVDVSIDQYIGHRFALPSIFPRGLSCLHTSLTIDRLYIRSDRSPYRVDPPRPNVSMRGSVQGAERLEVSPVFRLYRAHDFLQFLEAFAACTVTELALNLGPLPNDVDGAFWDQFFAALPDVRRLELMSRTTKSRETQRVIAKHFLASARASQQAGCDHETSLAWVLCGEAKSTSHLQEELGDVEEVLRGHAYQGGHLNRLELYISTYDLDTGYWSKVNGVAQVTTDEEASRFVARDYVSRLRDVAGAVIVGGGWEFMEDDEHTAEDRANNDEEEPKTGSDDMQVV